MTRSQIFAVLAAALALFAFVNLTCSPNGTLIPYNPPVTFKGYLGSDYRDLPGNIGTPNTCELYGDTIRIWCYSADFDKSHGPGFWYGYSLRIDINPFTIDTTCNFCLPHVLVRYCDYLVQTAQTSYVVYPADTIYHPAFDFLSTTGTFERSVGGRVFMQDMAVPLHLEGRSSVGIRISGATLDGHVERNGS
jgi:hypothetical protein